MVHINNDDLAGMDKEELATEFFERVKVASPDKLNGACQKWLHQGGKYVLLARTLMGEDVPQSEWDALIQEE